MRFSRALVAAAVAVFFLRPATAAAQPVPDREENSAPSAPPAPDLPEREDPPKPTHFLSPVRIISDGGSDLRRPPGWYLPDPTYRELDLRVRELQNDRTRLTAENASLRASADRPGWGWLLGFAIGTVGGIVATWVALR